MKYIIKSIVVMLTENNKDEMLIAFFVVIFVTHYTKHPFRFNEFELVLIWLSVEAPSLCFFFFFGLVQVEVRYF